MQCCIDLFVMILLVARASVQTYYATARLCSILVLANHDAYVNIKGFKVNMKGLSVNIRRVLRYLETSKIHHKRV